VGRRVAQIHTLVRTSPEYERLAASTVLYPDCWATFTGYVVFAGWDLTTDAKPLFRKGLRVSCLKAAVYELTGGEEDAGWATASGSTPPVP